MAMLAGVAQPGDTLWSVTSRTLYMALGRKPTNEEVSTAVLAASVPSGDFSVIYPGDMIQYRLQIPDPVETEPAPQASQPAPARSVSTSQVSKPPSTSASPVMSVAKKRMNESGNVSSARGIMDFMRQ